MPPHFLFLRPLATSSRADTALLCGRPVWSGALAGPPAIAAAWSRVTGATGGQETFASGWGPWSVPGAPGQQRTHRGDTPGGQAHHVRRGARSWASLPETRSQARLEGPATELARRAGRTHADSHTGLSAPRRQACSWPWESAASTSHRPPSSCGSQARGEVGGDP